MTSEFDVIAHYFSGPTRHTVLGIGDDAALLSCNPANRLAVSTDTLVSGTHFLPETDPYLLGRKTLAVNLSDMAACAAQPSWATLALTLPSIDTVWLDRFSSGFFAMAEAYAVDLVGGDTTRGPLAMTVTVIGTVPAANFLSRAGARPGDDLWVSGTLGDAALGLIAGRRSVPLSEPARSFCLERLNNPDPRVALGLGLRGLASSAIDISDGLVADAGHIARASGVGLQIAFAQLPQSDALRELDDGQERQQCLLSGGDDYELLFTAAPAHCSAIETLGHALGVRLTCVGKVVSGVGVRIQDAGGDEIVPSRGGYDHFS